MTSSRASLEGAGRRIAIVAARFNEVVTDKLVEGALAGLAAHGVAEDDVDVAWVPGAFEIPLVAARVWPAPAATTRSICLGAVIRGETAALRARGGRGRARHRARSRATTGVPVIFGVLATDTLAQAEDRAGGAHGNKGWDAAEAALEMASLLECDSRFRRREQPMIVDKPWGKVATYALNQPSSVRVITVEPGQETSVHYHRMRDEMWVVLDPGLTIQIGNRVVRGAAGRGVHGAGRGDPPDRAITGPLRGRVLEIAYGYTTEDDTQRLEDAYGRPLEPDW